MRLRGDRFSAGNVANASTKAKHRWMIRACPSLITPKLSLYGSGDAYQSWNSAQASEIENTMVLARPVGLRAPVSTSATMVSSASREAVGGTCSVVTSMVIPSPFFAPPHEPRAARVSHHDAQVGQARLAMGRG